MTGPTIKDVDSTTRELSQLIKNLTDLHTRDAADRMAAAQRQDTLLASLVKISEENQAKFDTLIQVISKTPPDPPEPHSEEGSNNNHRKNNFNTFSKIPKLDFPRFTEAVCNRFEDLANDNYVGCFNKLSQLTSVEEYFEQFKQLKALMLSKNPHLTEDYFVLSFISGLKDVLKSSVQMQKPTTLAQAFYLARLQELALSSQSSTSKTIPYKPTPTTFTYTKFTPARTPIVPSTMSASPSTPISQNSTPPPKTPYVPPIRRLTYEKMSKRRAQGLCFNCDEKYQLGHTCKSQQLFMMVADHEAGDMEPSPPQAPSEDQLVDSDIEISLHALTGSVNPDTIRIPGFIKKRAITVLEDTGSTHSFIDSSLATQLGCEVQPTAHMLVTVANGAKTTSTGICPQLQWTMQQQQFATYLRLLSLGGCDIVLGDDWLRTRDVTFNLAKLSISFLHKGQAITLQGTSNKPTLMLLSGNAMKIFIKKNTPALVGQFFSITMTPPPSTIPTPIQELLNNFSDVFEEPTQLPPPRILDHQINLKPDSQHVNLRPYKFPYIHKKLNSITIKDKFPIPVIDELLDELHGAIIFTRLDLRAGYHQIRVDAPDIHKTTFRTHHGHYEFKVMPFGLTNAPATFQALMNSVFGPYLRKFVLVFFDDILIYSSNIQEHVQHLSLVLSLLREHKLFVKFSKCCFSQDSLEYLGHIITSNGVAADLEKIACMKSWPIPTTLKQLRGFLGLTGYYRKFVKGYGNISKSLTDLLKNNPFLWSPSAEDAFNTLKNTMCTTPVLALPDFTKTFLVETDACSRGIGVVLIQDGRAIAFNSEPLGTKALRLSTYEKELLAVVNEVTKWKHYLTGHHFIIHTDQQSISAMALSAPAWTHDIINSYTNDAVASTLIPQILVNPSAVSNFTYLEGILIFKGRIYVGTNSNLRQHILHSIHSSAIGGHFGIHGSYVRAKTYFYWKDLNQDNLMLVSQCETCQQKKFDHQHPAGLLQPLPIPTQAWQHISMDFIEGLPKSQNKDVILLQLFLTETSGFHWIPLAEWWYNTNYHTSLKTSPFQALYGYVPPHLAFPTTSNTSVASVEEYLQIRDVVLDILKENLHKAQERMKRTYRSFLVGDMVYLKLQPYRQTSMTLRKNFKLSARYYGTFTVIQKIGEVDYKLQLSPHSKIHPVFHVSQLKKKIGASATTVPSLPLVDLEGEIILKPIATLDSRQIF
ncbi:uncharacterized protein LOC113330481 [Papaver somniferum]|uniref:uncharacterized protein LOC113330481 n=1 Tax=Papaver somniferum TaxID=3469 RepID=UPI000E701D9F|nr:uncharacterized protein LOC113330481 [Papaver somniferum]